MKVCAPVLILFIAFSGMLTAQVVPMASHATSAPLPSHASAMPAASMGTSAGSALTPMTQAQMASKVAIRVNGTELSELDVRREMVTIFPYAVQHNGFPKDAEPQIRKGAVEMIVFEELLYQEAKHSNLTVSPDRLGKG